MAGCPWTAIKQTSIPDWLVGGAVALALATLLWLILRPNSKSNTGLPLPPGSMGWPLLGETLDFMRSVSKSRTASTPSFMQARRKLYGDVYKTRVLGLDVVVVGGPEGQKFISSHDGKLLESQSLKTVVQRFGPNAMFIVNGEHHKRLRKAMHDPFSLGSLKARIASIESLTLNTLRGWEGSKEVNVMQESTKFTFSLILDMVLSLKPGPQMDYLWEQFTLLGEGGVSVPIRLPGTAFSKMLKARQVLAQHFQEIIDFRRNSKTRSEGSDILDCLLKPDSEQEFISDAEIIDNILFLLFAGYDTTALALTSVIRRLFQDPQLWGILQDEQDRILQELQGHSVIKPLTWESLKQMTHTTQTIYEAVRTSHIGDTLARIARQDLEFQGYRIPKGWTVFLDRDSANVDTRTFEEPDKFNPARFETGFPSTFSWAPFGNGPHMCLGMELAKLELSVFIHHLITKYRWRILTDNFSLDYGRAMPRYVSGIPTEFERRR